MKPTHLPKDPNQRAELLKKLSSKLSQLTTPQPPPSTSQNLQSTPQIDSQQPPLPLSPPSPSLHKKSKILQLRLHLISTPSQLTLTRITHLQQIFKHYCTHIFKIGKHMTFERLEYEKVHLTLDRFCVFLKDFKLNLASFQGMEDVEVVEKMDIVRSFKRISGNCRDLGFEEFIACLERLAVIYYDEKQVYLQKIQRNREKRQARIQQYRKKMKQKKKQQQSLQKLSPPSDNNNNKYDQNLEQQMGQKQEEKDEAEADENQENDQFVQKMMQDDKIQHVDQEIQRAGKGDGDGDGNQFQSSVRGVGNKSHVKEEIEEEYVLTVQQKIQYYYQLIGVDNIHDFRKKMSELGLPIFKKYEQSSSKKSPHKRSSSQILNITIQTTQNQQKRRLIQLRQKLNQKKQRDRHLYSPTLTKQQYEQRKKKRQEKQLDLLKQLSNGRSPQQLSSPRDKQRQKKKIDIMEKELSLDMINQISFNDAKIRFDPRKYVHGEESDKIFLKQYGAGDGQQSSLGGSNGAKKKLNQDINDRTATTLQRKRTSSNIVEDFKKRAYEIEVKQFHKEAQLSKFVTQMKRKQKVGWRKQII